MTEGKGSSGESQFNINKHKNILMSKYRSNSVKKKLNRFVKKVYQYILSLISNFGHSMRIKITINSLLCLLIKYYTTAKHPKEVFCQISKK